MKWNSKGRRRLIGCTITLVVLGAGAYGFQLQYPAAKAGRACGGMLPVDSLLDLTGKSRLSLLGSGFDVSSRQFDVSADVTEPSGLAARCFVGGAEISIETSAGALNAYGTYTFQRDQESFPIPLNAGWQGFMVTDDREANASVLLSCENWTAEEGSGLLVAATSPPDIEVTQDTRLNLARVVTGTARRAADRTGCVTEPGDEGKLTAPAADAETVSADDATGTCEGMTSVPKVRETAAGKSPAEECLLIGDLLLSAAYGPFNDYSDAARNGKYGGYDTPSGVDRDAAWTSATCEGALGIGFYRASPVEDSDRGFTADPLTKEERADLEHFAERSAARHGCGTPVALPS